ncbi:alpha/beta hydrolase [Mycobacterium sp. NPDC048908]|uniref:alpha/beta hydrolase n=1 Tax=Mycobacterium sp. NPDC048908 TaxID=3364292 RepID=UPI00371445BC
MTTTLDAAAQAVGGYRGGVSLLHGWLPPTIWAVAAVALVAAIGWRSRRWRLVWLPIAVVVGLILAACAHWYIDSEGLAGDPAPSSLWIWVGLTGLALTVALLGWRGTQWWRRGVSLMAVLMCLLSAGVSLNLWVGYFRTVQAAWNELTAGPLPDETDMNTVMAMRGKGAPSHGALVPVTIPADASGFKHRTELVYLPPAWFARNAPKLPVVMMIAGEFNTPSDWPRTGDAITPIDKFAAAHDGNTPVFVFVDVGGSFNNDTECVNGPRGNVADHLTKDVVPYVTSTFGVSPDPANWGIVGWSMGGTCAVDLTVMHPELFSTFVDIAGDTGPNAGTKEQTIARLYGGNAAAWATYDPTTVITEHGPYRGVSGWFAISSDAPRQPKGGLPKLSGTGLGGQDAAGMPTDQTEAANSLCKLGQANGITCAVIPHPGRHDWPLAGDVFTTALPWLAGQIGTPDAPKIALPGQGGAPAKAPPQAATR